MQPKYAQKAMWETPRLPSYFPVQRFLTFKSQGVGVVPMDPKTVFARLAQKKAEYPIAAVSWLLQAYHPASSDMCLKNKIQPRGNCVRIIIDLNPPPPWPTTGGHSTKINFPHTYDLWPLVAKHKCGLMVQSHINTNQNWLVFINHLLANNVTSSVRHLYATLYKWMGKHTVGSVIKILN